MEWVLLVSGWFLSGLIAARIDVRYGKDPEPAVVFWGGYISLAAYILNGATKAAVWWALRPPRKKRLEARETEARRMLALCGTPKPCGSTKLHVGHWTGEFRDEWCAGVLDYRDVDLEAM